MADFPSKVTTETGSPQSQGSQQGGNSFGKMISDITVTMDGSFIKSIPAFLMIAEIVCNISRAVLFLDGHVCYTFLLYSLGRVKDKPHCVMNFALQLSQQHETKTKIFVYLHSSSGATEIWMHVNRHEFVHHTCLSTKIWHWSQPLLPHFAVCTRSCLLLSGPGAELTAENEIDEDLCLCKG